MKIQIATGTLAMQDTANSKLMKLFVNQLEKMYWAEQKMAKILPVFEASATLLQLQTAYHDYLIKTNTHISRIDDVFGMVEEKVRSKKCFAISGIIDESQTIISETEAGTSQRDAGLIFACQKAGHYKIGTYGGLISVANTLGYFGAADLLKQTLTEEKEVDMQLTHLAEGHVNYMASREMS